MDCSSRMTALHSARTICADMSAMPSHIDPEFGCSRCPRIHDKAAQDRGYRHQWAQEKAGVLRRWQVQGRFSSEFPRMVDLTYHLSPTPVANDTPRLVNRFSDGALH